MHGYNAADRYTGSLFPKRPPAVQMTGKFEFIKPEQAKHLKELRLSKYRRAENEAMEVIRMRRLAFPKGIRELKLRAQDITAKRNGDGLNIIKAIVSPRT